MIVPKVCNGYRKCSESLLKSGDTALGIEITESGFRCVLTDRNHIILAAGEGSSLTSCYDDLCSVLGARPSVIGSAAIGGTDISAVRNLHRILTNKDIYGVGACSIQYPATWQSILAERKANRCSTFSGVLTASGASLIDSSGLLSSGMPFAAPEHSCSCALVSCNTVKPYEKGTVRTPEGIFNVRIFDNCDEFTTGDGRFVIATPEGYVSLWEKADENRTPRPGMADTCYGAALLAAYYNWSNNSEDLREYLSTYVFR